MSMPSLSLSVPLQRALWAVAGLSLLLRLFISATPDGSQVKGARRSSPALVTNSSFRRGASQGKGNELVMPYLQVKDARGQWKTVVEDMGIPSGKPKTISVDLAGKFLSASREVRIVTNLCVYWDEIFLSENSNAPQVITTPMKPLTADLHFRGFSKLVLDRDAVVQVMAAHKVLRLRADWTQRDPAITAELARHGRNGVPLYLLYASAQQSPRVLPELLTTGIVTENGIAYPPFEISLRRVAMSRITAE